VSEHWPKFVLRPHGAVIIKKLEIRVMLCVSNAISECFECITVSLSVRFDYLSLLKQQPQVMLISVYWLFVKVARYSTIQTAVLNAGPIT
jgi:hypothetical protein